MANNNGNPEGGYGKPPSHTQFVRGQSGNPKGRPRGSQNLSTILNKVGRERVKVTENGRTRYITKFEATILQLVNKAVAGDLNAARVLLSWSTWLANSEQTAVPLPVPHERDEAVMASILEHIRQAEDLSAKSEMDLGAKDLAPKKD